MCWGGVGCAHPALFSEGGRRETHNGGWVPLVEKLFDFLFRKETTALSKHLCVASTHHQGIAAGGRLQACGWQVCRESSERGQQRPPKHGQTMLHLSNSDWGYVGWHAPSLGCGLQGRGRGLRRGRACGKRTTTSTIVENDHIGCVGWHAPSLRRDNTAATYLC